MNKITHLFDTVGRALDSQWQAVNYHLELFPELAECALRRIDDFARPSMEEIYQWVLTAEIPRQQDLKARFSQPPLTVFLNDRFHIAFLFWTTSTTAIHEHSFEGAFQVFLGSSIQATYGFIQRFQVCDHMKIGDLCSQGISHLRKGDICRIDRGSSYIHSLYHLDHPSVTLIIRTHDFRGRLQFNYESSGIAINPFYKPERLIRVRQFLTHLNEIQHPDFAALASSSITASNLFEQYQILLHLSRFRSRSETNRWAELTGFFAGIFKSDLRNRDRKRRLSLARKTVHDSARRLFLALLLNIPTRAGIVKLLADMGERDPEEFIRDEVIQLCNDKTLGISDQGLTGHVIRGLLASPLSEVENCFKGTALGPLADEIRFVFQPIFDGPEPLAP